LSEAARWVIDADTRDGFGARAREVWQYRRILGFFSLKAVQSLYSKTRLGVSWIFIRTLVPLFVASFVFGSIMNVPSGGVPYFVFFLAGQIAWNCFDGPLIRGSRGLEVHRVLLTKLYIPRMILPLGQISIGIVESAIVTLVFVGALVYYHSADGVWYVQSGFSFLASIAAIGLILFFAFSLTLWTSVWQARARDTRFALRYVIGFWMYFTPVIYPMSVVPENLRWLMYLNPLTAPIEMFRWGTLPTTEHSWPWFGYSAAVALTTFIGGAWYFGHVESETMDKI
jgi:lipopolysaccharide transport system permease protein